MKARDLLLALFLTALACTQGVKAASEGIGWIPSWNQGLAEARQTNKPILLMAAAPECGGVPGTW